jgi:ribose transport system ATP-binding protein
MVEIAKALAREPKILILDEATSALTAADVERVFALLHRLRDEGLAIVYISHRMHEVAALADDCSVFRNGRHVATFAAGTRSNAETVAMMIGRDIEHAYPPKPPPLPASDARTPAIEVRDLSWNGQLHDIALTVRRGEIVGLGGLDGQGQRELFLALFGVLRGVSGEVRVEGEPVAVRSPREAKRAGIGIALVPEDRKTDGLMLPMSVRDNLSFAALDRFSRAGVVVGSAEAAAVGEIVRRLSIKAPELGDAAGTLSGGNQQKVVIAKWLLNAPRIVLLNDPTRGIDVGTKQEIHVLLRRLADDGAAVLLYSTDYAELIGCCDRVAVFLDGRIVRWLAGDDLNEHALVATALDVAAEAAH